MKNKIFIIVFFILSIKVYGQTEPKIIISEDKKEFTAPIKVLYESYAAIVERDSCLYRESLYRKKDNLYRKAKNKSKILAITLCTLITIVALK